MNKARVPAEVLILHGASAQADRPDEADTLVQVDAIASTLRGLGCRVAVHAVGLDLTALARFAGRRDSTVFNLVESLEGQGALLHLPAAVLETMGIAFTGASSMALAVTTDKPLAKRLLRDAGLPTPDWWETGPLPAGLPVIVKPSCEDASCGIDADSVTSGDSALAILAERRARLGGAWFAEAYVEGREFNVSLLAKDDGVEVLPAAEIRFEGFPEGRPRILDYESKWLPESAAYRSTRRHSLSPGEDTELGAMLADLSRRAWDLFGLHGYARVDFRVDAAGRPWIIEVNANPCLAPDAGFMGAASAAGLSFAEVLRRILADVTVPAGAGS